MASVPNQKKIKTHITYSLKEGNFVGIPRELFFSKMRELGGGSAFCVWCYLTDNQDGYEDDFSPANVSEQIGYSPDSIRNAINKLIKGGYLIPRTSGSRYYDFYPDPDHKEKVKVKNKKINNSLSNRLGGAFNV